MRLITGAPLFVLLMLASCEYPRWIPYRSECLCECDGHPCAELTMMCCDDPDREDDYRRAFSTQCDEYKAEHGYSKCTLVRYTLDDGSSDTISHPNYECEQPKVGYAWEL